MMNILIISPHKEEGQLLEKLVTLSCGIPGLNFFHANALRELVACIFEQDFELIFADPDFPKLGNRLVFKTLCLYRPHTPMVAVHCHTPDSCNGLCAVECHAYGARWHFNRFHDLEKIVQLVKHVGGRGEAPSPE